MLHSKNCRDGEKRPVFQLWFGHFFEPYYSSKPAVCEAIEDIRNLGFNSVILDSKLWKDFTVFFQTGQQSQYVEMENFIVSECHKHGLGITFLALYLCGDNLYPRIYDNPPEFVDQPVDIKGNLIRGYKLWSENQRKAHVEHCLNLYKYIAGKTAAIAHDRDGNERLPFYLYHDPAFSPSFSTEDIKLYQRWLSRRYTIEQINDRYGINVNSFDTIPPEVYWLYPITEKEMCYDHQSHPSMDDYRKKNKNILKYIDNQLFKLEVMKTYFKKLAKDLKVNQSRFFLYSSLNQWKYFFNDHPYWDTGSRVIDIWDIGESLDSPSFITYAVDTFGDVNPYVVSCEMAMLRSAAGFKDFVGGLFLGRYMYCDVYNFVTPAQMLAAAFGAGATDMFFYGYSGLDDGGNLGKWTEEKRRSLKMGLDWFAVIREIAGKRVRDYKAAIVFPLATFLLQHNKDDRYEYACNRNDLLGWYQQLADMGINPDILHPSQIKAGELRNYSLVIMPADPLSWAMPDSPFEDAIYEFVRQGGLLLRSATAGHETALGIEIREHLADTIAWDEKIITDSLAFKTFNNGTIKATYLGDSAPAIVEHQLGDGRIISFGFDYGFAYCLKQQKPVPGKYGKDNQYFLTVIKQTPVEQILDAYKMGLSRRRGVERIEFENGELIINHTAYPQKIDSNGQTVISTDVMTNDYLPAHASVFIKC